MPKRDINRHFSRAAAITVLPARATPSCLQLVAAGINWAMGILITYLLPVLFQAMQESRGLGEGELGALGAAFMVGMGVSQGTGPFWARRSSPRWISVGSLTAVSLGLLGVAVLSDAANLIWLWLVVGFASGCLATPSFMLLGDTPNPVRTYGLALFGTALGAAALSFGLPLVVTPSFGGSGVLAALAALFVFALPWALALPGGASRPIPATLVPDVTPGAGREPGESPLALVAPILATLSGATFTGVVFGMIFYFVVPIGAADGIGPSIIGPLIAAALMAALVGSILPSLMVARFTPNMMIGASVATTLVCYPLMMSGSAAAFCIAFIAQAVAANVGYTCFLGVVRRIDFTDRIYIAYPALQSLGIAAGTALAGEILARSSAAALMGVSAALLIAALLGMAVAARLSIRARETAMRSFHG